MSNEAEIQHISPKRAPPVPPTRRRASHLPSSSNAPSSTPVFSSYRMNDIPRGTPRAKLINSLLSPNHVSDSSPASAADVQFGLLITDSRLDDELSVATIEFSNTPRWLQALTKDTCGFPKKTAFGTLWRGVDPNGVAEHGQSLFTKAVINGATDVYYAEMMAEFDSTDVNIQDDRGRTALHWASALDLSVMEKLCLSVPDCDVGLRDNDGLTAFDLAQNEKIQHHFYRSVFEMDDAAEEDALLRVLTLTSVPAGDGRPVFPGAALFQPIEHRNTRLVAALIDRRVDLTARNEDGDTALHVAAAQSGGVEIATLLVRAGADVNAVGNGGATPLRCAAYGGEVDIARVLLANGAVGGVQDEAGATAMDLAESKHDRELVDLLNEAADVDADPEVEMVAREPRLLTGAIVTDIESKNKGGLTPLQQAVELGDLDRVHELILLGADKEVRDRRHNTPLLRAARLKSWDIFDALLNAGADSRAVGKYGLTALLCAAAAGPTNSVKTLLTLGADIQAFGRGAHDHLEGCGYTALHYAVSSRRHETVKVLLEGEANLEVKDPLGETVLSLALSRRDPYAPKMLLNAGAHCSASDCVRYLSLRARRIGRSDAD